MWRVAHSLVDVSRSRADVILLQHLIKVDVFETVQLVALPHVYTRHEKHVSPCHNVHYGVQLVWVLSIGICYGSVLRAVKIRKTLARSPWSTTRLLAVLGSSCLAIFWGWIWSLWMFWLLHRLQIRHGNGTLSSWLLLQAHRTAKLLPKLSAQLQRITAATLTFGSIRANILRLVACIT